MDKDHGTLNVFHHFGLDGHDLHRIVIALEKIADAIETNKHLAALAHTLNRSSDKLEAAVKNATPSETQSSEVQ